MEQRIETDLIGHKEIQKKALYGIHSLRAKENFPIESPFPIEWYKGIGKVKQACYLTYKNFKIAILKKYNKEKANFTLIGDDILSKLIESAEEVSKGLYYEHFIVPAIQGSAGTSINMNINEIITNVSLQKLGHNPGEYSLIDPIEHANIFQSTNDIIPTSLKLSIIELLKELETSINANRSLLENLEQTHRNSSRIGYTQMQEAVPTTYGRLFSTYNDALSRDWWRISKGFERIKTVNLGGSAIGTSIAVPRYFVMEVCNTLQQLCNLPITRSENLSDATSNMDSFVEVHAILKAHAVNLEKIASDMRLLASDVVQNKEIELPQKQAGSSIMPGKVNPVISEFVITISHKVYTNDSLIAQLSGLGCLELNAYVPTIGLAFIESLKLLIAANQSMAQNLLAQLKVNSETANHRLYKSPAITTALLPYIGYNKASELAKQMKSKGIDVFQANTELKLLAENEIKEILNPEHLSMSGYTMDEILKGQNK